MPSLLSCTFFINSTREKNVIGDEEQVLDYGIGVDDDVWDLDSSLLDLNDDLSRVFEDTVGLLKLCPYRMRIQSGNMHVLMISTAGTPRCQYSS